MFHNYFWKIEMYFTSYVLNTPVNRPVEEKKRVGWHVKISNQSYYFSYLTLIFFFILFYYGYFMFIIFYVKVILTFILSLRSYIGFIKKSIYTLYENIQNTYFF